MKRRTWAGNTLVVSTILMGGFAVSAKLLSNSPAEGQISADVEDLYRDLLEQAQTDAQHDRLPQAMVAVTGIPSNSRHHPAAQQLREHWSKDLLRVAQKEYSRGQPREAIELLKAIPASSSMSAQAKNLQTSWSSQLKQLEQAEVAYRNSNWDQALRSLESLKNTPLYSSPRLQEMLQQSIAAAFNPGEGAIELSTTDKIIPARLTAQAPSPSQLEVGSAPELSPIAMDVELAMQQTGNPPILVAQPIRPSAQSSSRSSLPSDSTAIENTVSNKLSTPDVVPVVATPPIGVNDSSATTEAIGAVNAGVQTVSSPAEVACSPASELSPAPEFSTAMRLKQNSSKMQRGRDRSQMAANSAQLVSCKP